MTTLGERIRTRRRELNLTLRELGAKAHLSFSFLSDVERGRRSIGADSLLALSVALEVPMDYLMGAVQDRLVSGNAVQIPQSLIAFASSANIPFRTALCLYWCARTLQDYRGRGRLDLEQLNWDRLHSALQDWL